MVRYIYILLLQVIAIGASAQKLIVKAPSQVSVGEQFEIVYSVNTKNIKDFRPGNTPDGIKILYGPSTSSQSSFQMVNGHTSSQSSVEFSYVACITRKGTYTIPAAHITTGGRTIASEPFKITATGASQGASANNKPNQIKPSNSHNSPDMENMPEALFIRVSASKKRVHEQEPILLTYKVYTLLELIRLEGKMPDLKGFHIQEVKLPQQKSFHRETINGTVYNCVTWSQYVMYPQMTGDLEIPSLTFSGIVLRESRSRDPFSFITGRGYEEEKRSIDVQGLVIHVDPLPKKPADFSGGVGQFNISAQMGKTDIKAGDPANLRIVVSGTGNLKLIKQPVVKFPDGWDQYDAKITDKTRLTVNGVEGNMIYDIVAVPRKQGKYTIPAISFTYYDTKANQYKTVKTQSFTMNVSPGNGTENVVSDYMTPKNEDIRPIKEGKITSHAVDNFFFGSAWYWILLLFLVAVFVTLLFMFRRTVMMRADAAFMRGRNADKVARKRLLYADTLMKQNQPAAFYDEVLHALWGYVSDRLNIPIEELSRDNISERLLEHGVHAQNVEDFIAAIDECEFERYAPGDAKGNMNKTFEKATNAIVCIEDAIKTSKTTHSAVMLLMLAMLTVPLMAHAITKENADTEYKKGNYQQAIKDYEEILQKGVSAELYYNLGNAYYRADNIPRAILSYERASLLSPSDKDIRFNLQMARSKSIDKITPESEMFFVTWYKSLVNLMSVDGWAYAAIFSILLVIVFILLYLFTERIWLRKVGFYSAVAFLLLFLFANVFAFQQKSQLDNRTGAIIISPSVSVRKTPSSTAKESFVLHEGTKVQITDKSMKNWSAIHIADGREGWIETKYIEEI